MNKFIPSLLLFFFISMTFTTVFTPVSASSELIEDSWNTKKPMHQARTSLGTVTIDGKIYAIGGRSVNGKCVDTNEQYDPTTNTWVTLASMPTPRDVFAIAAYEGKIYCIGGGTDDPKLTGPSVWFPLDVNEVYDIATDSWSTKAPIPTIMGAFNIQAYVVGEKIFVVTRETLYAYDPVRNSWTNITSTPASDRSYTFSVMINNKIIIFERTNISTENGTGGYRYTVQTNVLIYDTKTNVWSKGQTSPEFTFFNWRINSAGATTGVCAPEKIYCIGVQYLNDMEQQVNCVYDPIEDTWSTAKTPSKVCSDCSVTVVDDVLYVIGGTINEQYVPIGYDPGGYSPRPSDITPVASDDTSSGFYDFKALLVFLTEPVVAIIVLTVCVTVVVSVFFYTKRRKNNISKSNVNRLRLFNNSPSDCDENSPLVGRISWQRSILLFRNN